MHAKSSEGTCHSECACVTIVVPVLSAGLGAGSSAQLRHHSEERVALATFSAQPPGCWQSPGGGATLLLVAAMAAVVPALSAGVCVAVVLVLVLAALPAGLPSPHFQGRKDVKAHSRCAAVSTWLL